MTNNMEKCVQHDVVDLTDTYTSCRLPNQYVSVFGVKSLQTCLRNIRCNHLSAFKLRLWQASIFALSFPEIGLL